MQECGFVPMLLLVMSANGKCNAQIITGTILGRSAIARSDSTGVT
jgi:hypothetical protein